jgi:uncharacterized protein (TIGR03118 family)
MFWNNWRRRSRLTQPQTVRRPSVRLNLEPLEDRTVPAGTPPVVTGLAITAVEGTPFTGNVATFTDANTNTTVASFSATVNFGDGTPAVTVTSTASANGQIIADPVVAKQFDVQTTHTFPTDGQFSVVVTVTDTTNSVSASSASYTQANLVTDNQTVLMNQGFAPAAHTDPNLVNPWGIVASPGGSPFWVSDNNSGKSTLYDGSGNSQPQPTPLVVTIPVANGGTSNSTGSPSSPAPPTGVVFNGSSTDFLVAGAGTAAHFIFATEDGTIAAWNSGANAVLKVDDADFTNGPVYKGLAIGNNGTGSFLYAANFRQGTVDVFDTNFHKVTLGSGGFGTFADANLPAGFAPFNVQNIGGQLYVTYAKQNASKHDDVAGPGNGFVDLFDLSGHLLRRFASAGTLNSPWGLALAPSTFGPFAGDLLVGNFGDGRINAFDPSGGAFLGQLTAASGQPITIDGLWGLSFGNNGMAGSSSTLFFTAGINGEMNGLLGSLTAAGGTAAVGESSDLAVTATAFTAGLTPFSGQVATFSDGGNTEPAGNFTASIHWGDGSADSAGTVSQPNGSGTPYVVTAAGTPHTFNQAGSPAFTVTVTETGVANGTATNGATATVKPPANVYVNPAFTGPAGSDPDGAGPATAIGYDAFATIQAALNAVAFGGTVNIAAGTYAETLTISRSAILLGAGSGTTTLSGSNTGTGINITAAGGVSVTGLTIHGFATGFVAGSATTYLALTDVRLNGDSLGGSVNGVNTFLYQGGSGDDTIFVNPTALAHAGDNPINYTGVQFLTVDGGGGNNTLQVFLNNTNAADKIWFSGNAISRDTAKFLLFYRSTGGSFGGGVAVVLGGGAQTVIVQGQAAGAPTTIYGQGNVVFDVAVTASSGYSKLTLDGGGGNSTLNIFPSGSTVSQNVPFPGGGIGEFVDLFAGGLTSVIGYQNMGQVFSA